MEHLGFVPLFNVDHGDLVEKDRSLQCFRITTDSDSGILWCTYHMYYGTLRQPKGSVFKHFETDRLERIGVLATDIGLDRGDLIWCAQD